VKRILWILLGISLLSSASAPMGLYSDGPTGPTCPNGKTCKPLEAGTSRY
jgi:hypothetical protein